MGSQWTHDKRKKTKCLSFHPHWRCESGWEYWNLVGHRNLFFQNRRPLSVKEGTAGTEDAREYDEVYRRAVRSGNAVEWTRAKPTEQLQLSLGSALLTGAKISKGPKPEEFVSIVNRYRCRKRIREDIGRVRSERHLQEWMVFAPPHSTKPEQAWQSKTCLQCCLKVQRSMPKW